jgi:hypothetical protein
MKWVFYFQKGQHLEIEHKKDKTYQNQMNNKLRWLFILLIIDEIFILWKN